MSPSSSPPGWEPPLLERGRELAEFDARGDDARAGCGATVLIEAGAGMGKTRLLRHLTERSAAAGVRVLSARASESERDYPVGVVRRLFAPSEGEDDDPVGRVAGAVTQAVEGDANRASPRGGPSFATLDELHSSTVNLSRAGPLLLVLDDAHWADPASLRFLMFLALRLDGLPLLLAVASRPDSHGESPLARLSSDPSTLRLSPSLLGRESVAKTLQDALGLPPDAEFASACYELTGGNPFLVAELTRTLAAGDVPAIEENVLLARTLVPESIARAVLSRLNPLPDPAGALARSVAILGDGCELRLAAALAEVDSAEAHGAADSLRAAEILRPEGRLGFVHPLVRGAVYEKIPAGARSRAHGRAAALLTSEGGSLEPVAAHLLATVPAGDPTVTRQLRDAARASLDDGAAGPAIAYLLRALAEPPPGEERTDVLELLLTAAVRGSDAAAVLPLETELLEAFTSDPRRLMRFGQELAMWLIGGGQLDRAAEILESAIGAAEQAGDLGLAVALEAQLTSFTQLPPRQARERFRRYAGRLIEDSPEHRLSLALNAWWGSLLGDPASEVADLAERALAGGQIFAEQPDSPVPGQAVLVLARADELDAAETASAQQVAEATERGAAASLTAAWYERGYVARRRGHLRSAEADARQALAVANERGCLTVAPLFTALLIEVLVQQDDIDTAEDQLNASGMAREVPDGYWLGPVLFSRGQLRLAQGRARDSADDFLDLRERMIRWEIPDNPALPASAYAARALAALGERERALTLAEEQLATARRWGTRSAVGEALAALGSVTEGDHGIELAEEAIRVLAAAPVPLIRATALVELGQMLRHARRAADAREPLRAGLAIARRYGAVALARRAAEELEASGEKLRRFTPIGTETLTASERRVAVLAARGMKNREIAATLHVATKTVESHLHAAYDKLGIRSRHNLAKALGAGF